MRDQQTHEVFKEELRKGFIWQDDVARFLKGNGLPASVPEHDVRETNPNREFFAEDSGDIWCGDIQIEVKSRELKFTGPWDLPYDDMIVDDVRQYQEKVRKGFKPKFYVNVSQVTGALTWMSVEQFEPKWTIKERVWHTKIQEYRDLFMCPKLYWDRIERLTIRLKKELGIK